jgi:hypothetical protein
MTWASFGRWILVLGGFSQAWGFQVEPRVSLRGQALEIICREDERECLSFCEGRERCQIAESPCPGCAGTTHLQLKRILDAVGTGLQAVFPERPQSELWTVLRSGGWMSLHARTLFNYSSAWNGEWIRSAFFHACVTVQEESAEGILLLRVGEGWSPRLESLGFICRKRDDGEVTWWGVSVGRNPK